MAKAEYKSAIRSKRLINDALADLLQEKPLDKITVTDVVKRADINRGTFYAHYRDIPDVVDHLIQQTFDAIRSAVDQQTDSISDVGEKLLSTIQIILEEDLFFYRKILNSNASVIMQEQLVNVVIDFMMDHKNRFYSGSNEEYMIKIRFCAGGLSNLYRDWFSGKLPYSLNVKQQKKCHCEEAAGRRGNPQWFPKCPGDCRASVRTGSQ